MRGTLLPVALLCVGFGLAMGFVSRASAVCVIALLVAAAITVVLLPLTVSTDLAFAGCWASLIAVALTTYATRGAPRWMMLALALVAGACAGTVASREGHPSDLALALPLALICLPAMWIVDRGWSIGIRVVCSWLIAVALLSALLPTAGTPGYVADHMG